MTARKRRHVLSADRLVGAVFRGEGTIEGYVYNPEQLHERFVVELWLDGWPNQVRRADLFDRRSPVAETDAHHGFCFNLPHLCTAREAEVRLANTPILIGTAQDLTSRTGIEIPLQSAGAVSWSGGLFVEGHLFATAADATRVRGIIDETIVFDVAPLGWTHTMVGGSSKPVRRFEAHLPAIYGDGRVHRLEVVTSDGHALANSPIDIVAYFDGLEHFISAESGLADEKLRARVFDALTPRSVPFAWLDDWLERFPVNAASSPSGGTVAVVLVGEENVERSVRSLEASETSWILGVLSCDPKTLQFESADLRAFLDEDASTCDTIIVAMSGTHFDPRMASHFASALGDRGGMAFADVVLTRPGRAHVPVAHAGFDLERLLEQGAGALLFAMTRETIFAAACEQRMSVFDLFLQAFDAIGERRPHHVPGFLGLCPSLDQALASQALSHAVRSYLERHGARARIEIGQGTMLPAVHLARTTAAEQVTILVPARNRLDDLRTSVDAIRSMRSRHGIDLHVVDMANSDDAMLSYLDGLNGHHQHVFRSGEPFDTARALNRAVAFVRSRFILFLEAGCVFDSQDAIDELIGRCAEPDVVAAGPLLVGPEGIIEAAGLVGGMRFPMTAAFSGLSQDDPGEADLLRVARSCLALPLAGLTTRRRDFLSVGGFDGDRLGRHLFCLDYGLKLLHQGKRLVFTPHARLTLPRGCAFHGDEAEAERRQPGLRGETDAARSIWGDALSADGVYSPSLAPTRRPFTALAWPPRSGSLHAPASDAVLGGHDDTRPAATRTSR